VNTPYASEYRRQDYECRAASVGRSLGGEHRTALRFIAVRVGRPGEGYPWHWSIVPWLKGAPADICPADADQGARLARFFHALHVPAPENAPLNAWRGVPPSDRGA
jgi:hypothetical protein